MTSEIRKAPGSSFGLGMSAEGGGRPIALDAMGGDHAPALPVQGAIAFCRASGRRVLLVGDEDAIRRELDSHDISELLLDIVPASQVIDFHDKIAGIRNKRDSSIHVASRLVRDGKAAALVSAGHTGAMMALGKVIYGVVPGVDRPALPAPIPRRGGGATILVDAGANLHCRPEHFRQFAVMGYHYARRVFGTEDPKVGLLSIGEEDTKGTTILKSVSAILRETKINFIGNVEGNCLFSDAADVVVCDGFVGNVALKMGEGAGEAVIGLFRDEIKKSPLRRLAALSLMPVFNKLRKQMDYAEIGGVPLLGLKKLSVVAHGRSNAKAFHNALRVAATLDGSGLIRGIEADIASLREAEKHFVSEWQPVEGKEQGI